MASEHRSNDDVVDDMTAHKQITVSATDLIESLATKMSQVLTQNQDQTPATTNEHSAAQIGIKLDGTNYPLWSQVVEMYISAKDKLGYINGDISQPETTDPTFRKWRTENAIVKGWLINSMDQNLVSNFIRFSTAKQVWDSIAITYFDGSDTSQVYALKRQVNNMKQAEGSIESYYNNLQGLWREIDFRRPNPMDCNADIQKYNTLLQEDRVYTFLDGLNDRLDKIRSDVLQMKPFPTVEQAYAHVRREEIRQMVMLAGADNNISAVMTTKGIRGVQQSSNLQMIKGGTTSSHGGRLSTKIKGQEIDGGGCSHCGNKKHNIDGCFKVHGYPEWWNDMKAKKQKEVAGGSGRVALASAEPQLSLISQVEYDSKPTSAQHELGHPHQGDHWAWY
ncbi:unnamed protein product [Trifolium pratense]|uniref:Uncharacterized protein n=1 Tax=Trifolium pratense TaxID=57577 RepID=A0ACB0LE63_TRIPR|nr:unnamed protein product [Trifolium pratense]